MRRFAIGACALFVGTPLLAAGSSPSASSSRRLTVRCESGSWAVLDDSTGRPVTRWSGAGVLELAGRDEDDDWLTIDLNGSSTCPALPDIRFDGGVGGYDGM